MRRGRFNINTVDPTIRKDVTVICNRLQAKASAGKLVDGFDALIWLIKQNGGSLPYRDALLGMRDPKYFGKWMTRRFKTDKKRMEVKLHGGHPVS